MEEENAVAYYDELTRKGQGAARFKRGLGFSSGNDAVPSKSSSSSFLSNFVKASSPPQTSNLEKQAQLETIQNKLKKKSRDEPPRSERSSRESSHRQHGSRNRDRDDKNGERYSSKRSRSRSRSGERRRNIERNRERERDRDRRTRRSRSRSWSPRKERRSEKRRSLSPRRSKRDTEKEGKERNGGVDYSRLIDGYDKMTPSERVKARMKLQLDETAEKDVEKGMSSGWERFEFNKDAPLDDEEIEAAEDDTTLVKHIGQSFRFSAVEARREDQIKAAHDEAMFGAPALSSSVKPINEPETEIIERENSGSGLAASLISEKVLAKQQGSWRDRARKT
ncbi:hypothetical protein HS088_TW20G00473 [Tripterygium wilfordii]|uniref:Uncharacterized protein n=1 Tax=Tripterygium wilfordii TaxID=458696 RepID=A0A7J7C7J3_TRIWF|nr:serine/Arginine-related protein 53 [Tripterygium wilfordii]KAF5730103.1 hypothetical protein HS088_TW20G00473 [Tripterygium wilfordii]